MDIIISAPGKVILFGEHAVVYGKPAIAASISKRTYLWLQENSAAAVPELVIDLPDMQLQRKWPLSRVLAAFSIAATDVRNPHFDADVMNGIVRLLSSEAEPPVICAILFLLAAICGKRVNQQSVRIIVRSEVPVGAGLGSSAAVAVCVASALLLYVGEIKPPTQGTQPVEFSTSEKALINGWAYAMEQVMHGTPSGIDNSVSTYDIKGHPIQPLERVTPSDLAQDAASSYSAHQHQRRNTKKLVEGVRARWNDPRTKAETEKLLDEIEAVSRRSISTLHLLSERFTASVFEELEALIDKNHQLLTQIGVGHPKLDLVVQTSKKYGFSAKLTGAGGGGCALTFLRDRKETSAPQVKTELTAHGFDCYEIDVGGPGVLFHPPSSRSSLPYFHNASL